MILDLRYLDIIGPGRVYYSPGNPGFVGSLTAFRDLQDGISSESFADEVAAELAANLNTAYGTDFEAAESNPPRDPDPAPEPPTPPPLLDPIPQLYLDRAAAAPRVMARWAAGNELRLTSYVPPTNPFTQQPMLEPDPNDYETDEEYDAAVSAWMIFYNPDTHGWAPNLFASFMQEVGPVVILLNSLAFGATAQAIQAFDHPLATAAAKAAYLADMAAEGAMP